MEGVLRNWRIVSALLFSTALIVGAYVLTQGISSPTHVEASTETALLEAIATRDSDNDGLPDWEESLYGTNPQVADTFKLGMTDGAAVAKGLIVPKAIANMPGTATTSGPAIVTDPGLPPPPAEGTITATFARNLFTAYLAAVQKSPDGNLSDSDTKALATDALAQLMGSVVAAPDFKSMNNLVVSGSGPQALKEYAASVEAIFLANKGNAQTSEIVYLKKAVEESDDAALTHIAAIAKMYRMSAAGLAALAVPQELAQADLDLMNAMSQLSSINEDFTRVNTDPLATILALKQYPNAVKKLSGAFVAINQIYKNSGVVLAKGEPGASIVNLIADVAAEQKATNKQ